MKWITVIWTLGIIGLAHSVNDKPRKKKAKVLACLTLTNERVNQDKETFAKMAGKMDDKLGGQDYLGRLHEMLLINCYQEIDDLLTERILLEVKSKRKLNLFDKDFQKLLLPQLDPSKTDVKKYQETAAEVGKYIQEIKADEEKMKKKTSNHKNKANEKKAPIKKANPNAKWEYDQYEDTALTWKDLLSIKNLIHYSGINTYCGITIATLIALIIIKKNNQKTSTKPSVKTSQTNDESETS